MPVDEGAVASIKAATEAIKAATEALHPDADKARAGPLVVVGRLYISLTIILGAFTSAAAFIELKASQLAVEHSMSLQPLSDDVLWVRRVFIGVVVAGLILGVALIWALIRKHTLYLFSPTELPERAQQAIYEPQSKEGAEKQEKGSGPVPPTTADTRSNLGTT